MHESLLGIGVPHGVLGDILVYLELERGVKVIIGRAEQGSEVPQRRHEVAPKHLSERPS